jgi:LemA protein
MKKALLIGLAVVGVLIILLIATFISLNNRLVALQENVHSAWGQVETVLQRRYDLIPNLV